MNNHRTPPLPDHFNTITPGICRWCNKSIGRTKKGRESKATWHTECVAAYKLLHWPAVTRRAVWKRDKGHCNVCGTICEKKGTMGWQMDHIVPLIEANGEEKYWRLANLQTLCKACHKAKTSQEATDRATRRRLL